MKLRVVSKDAFDRWFESFILEKYSQYGEDVTRWIDVEKMFSLPFAGKYKVIDVQPSMTVKQIIKTLLGKELITITEPNASKGIFESMIITECYIYCLQCQSEELDPEKKISDYFIEENDTLLLGEHTRTERSDVIISYRVCLFRDITDFSYIVRTQQDIENSPGLLFRPLPLRKGITDTLQESIEVGSMFNGAGLRPVESVLLYTDEDMEISKYIRYNFASLDVMTGHHLNLYAIEQPLQVNGISARIYWKNYLEERVFSIFQLLGWTKYKPYDKSNAYRIAEMLGLYPESLPCVVIFGDIKSDEKIVIPIIEEYPIFFRNLSSIVLKTINELFKSKKGLYSFSDFKNLFLSKWDHFMETQQEKPTSIFTFNGNTVFINKPEGPFEISDFQKDS
ncbi:MAG TPA: hypothetical protein GXX65_08185 [Methanosarcina sp.]|nr:hypothetical protein [Methanosarcina sp.]